MATEVLCPICGATYNLAEDQLGKRLRCKKCEHTFVAGGKGRERDDDGIQTEPRKRPAKATRRGRDDDDDDRPARKTPKLEDQARNKQDAPGMPIGTFIMAGVGLAVVLLLCGGGGWMFYHWKSAPSAPPVAGGGGININIPAMPGGGGAIGGFIPPAPIFGPGVQPANLNEAIEALKSNEASRRQGACEWLAQAPVDPARRADVARALDGLVGDGIPQVRGAACKALGTWGGADNVPTLVRELERKDNHTIEPALTALAKLKDPRGATVIASLLPDFFQRARAINALRDIGKPAEKEVVKYYFHPDHGARDEAKRLLDGFGTDTAVILDQAIVELTDGDEQRRTGCCQWLAQALAHDGKKAEVARALDPLIRNGNDNVRNPAIAAAKVWGTPENVPALTGYLKAKSTDFFFVKDTCAQAMEALGRIGDPRGAEACLPYLGDFFIGKQANDAVRAIGAKGEQAVLTFYNHPDEGKRNVVRQLIRDFNTKQSLIVVQSVKDLSSVDGKQKAAAADYLEKSPMLEEYRPTVSNALSLMLVDTDANVKAAGYRMAKTWATRDNVPALVREVINFDDKFDTGMSRRSAMDALAAIKDERGVWPVAKCVGDFFVGAHASKALLDMGPIVEKELLNHLAEPDPNDRDRAWAILGDVGTKASLEVLKGAVAKETNPAVKAKANATIKRVQARL